MKHNFKVREERHSVCRGRVWSGINPTSFTVNVSSGLMADSKSRHCWQMKREPYSENDKCEDTENLKVVCRPTASRTGNTPPQTQAQQWTQMLMTQGLILVKHKSSNLVGSLFLFRFPLELWAPCHLCPAHYRIRATYSCWRGKCSSTDSPSPGESSRLCLVQRNVCVQGP